MPQQGCLGQETRAPPELLGGIAAQQVKGQRHRRPPPRHVVLEIAVEPLVAQVELGCEGEDENVEIEGLEAERLAQQRQRCAAARGVGRPCAIQQRGAGRGSQRALGLVGGDAQAAIGICRRLLAEAEPRHLDRRPEQGIEPLQHRREPRPRGIAARGAADRWRRGRDAGSRPR